MANEFQESLFSAIDLLVKNQVNQLATDKTVTGSIVKCSNALTGEYKVSYNNGLMYAYAQEGQSYTENTSVYILVPEGDFTKKKIIIGKAALVEEGEMNFVSSTISNYNLVGQNTILDLENQLPVGLFSYKKQDKILLYDKTLKDESLLTIKGEELNTYIQESEAIMIKGDFQTRLPRAHRYAKTGKYGIQFLLAFKDLENTYCVYDVYLPNIIIDEEETNPKEFLSNLWLKENSLSIDEKIEKSILCFDTLQKYKDDYFEELSSIEKLYISNFIGTKFYFDKTKYTETQIKNIVDQYDAEIGAGIKYLSYTLDSDSMTGNPFLYNQYSDQYGIFPIDTQNFLYIENIIFFSEGFEEEDQKLEMESWGKDIFVKNIEFIGLKTITATNGDYSLSLSTPYGSVFKTIDREETLTVIGRLTYQINNDYSKDATYYWFVEDSRVTSDSENYQMYGGKGWKWLKDKGAKDSLVLYDEENLAYKNNYLCVVVYEDALVLKAEFTIYNEASKRELEISSNLGTSFCFDRGTPELTCLIDGKKENFDLEYPDDYFSFIWSKVDEYGQVILLNKTYDELKAEYEELQKQEEIDYSELTDLKNQMILMEKVSFDRNVLKYPVVNIDKTASFKCGVYLKNDEDEEPYSIGSAEITLQNSGNATPTDYYILIKNGDQVFQYSESGVAPNNERYTDPLEVLPLECVFYDPAGLEVNPDTYQVKWTVPLEDTMIVTPQEGMELNPSTGLIEYYPLKVFPLQITESYDYQALKNQIKATIIYNEQEYVQETTLLFTKIGNNGTNGTDVVCKIEPIVSPPIGESLALELIEGQYPVWNTGVQINNAVLEFKAYNRNELLDFSQTSVYWKMAGGVSFSKNMTVDGSNNQAIIGWNSEDGKYSNQIIRGNAYYEGQTYYSFYPVPVIDYAGSTPYKVIIDKEKTLKYITYNADGRNPLYNKNQGVFLKLPEQYNNKYFVWTVSGGEYDNEVTSEILILKNKDGRDLETQEQENPSTLIEGTNLTNVYVFPKDICLGSYCNNMVICKIYDSQADYGANPSRPEVTIYTPIHLSLNTFGLTSLNQWDGNSVEINEDENYILAPQVGAGVKNDDNTFSGMVMGRVESYENNEPEIGMFGYANGKQSMFLDAETGNATFGLPEAGKGQIKIRPGGTSSISGWNMNLKSFYYVVPTEEDGPNKEVPLDSKTWVSGAEGSIPAGHAGIYMSNDPTFFSIQGRIWEEKDLPPADDRANLVLEAGDNLELELNPNNTKDGLFTIYRHYIENNKWTRRATVGIDNYGRFYSNAIKDASTSLYVGKLGAFGYRAMGSPYMGAQFETEWGGNIIKFFQKEGTASRTYISGGNSDTNEYGRALSLYGSSIDLYCGYGTSTETDSKVQLTDESFYAGNPMNYIHLDGDTEKNVLKLYRGTENNNQQLLFLDGNLKLTSQKGETVHLLSFGPGSDPTGSAGTIDRAILQSTGMVSLYGGNAGASISENQVFFRPNQTNGPASDSDTYLRLMPNHFELNTVYNKILSEENASMNNNGFLTSGLKVTGFVHFSDTVSHTGVTKFYNNVSIGSMTDIMSDLYIQKMTSAGLSPVGDWIVDKNIWINDTEIRLDNHDAWAEDLRDKYNSHKHRVEVSFQTTLTIPASTIEGLVSVTVTPHSDGTFDVKKTASDYRKDLTLRDTFTTEPPDLQKYD